MGPFVMAKGCEPDFYPKQSISDTMRAGAQYQPRGKMPAVGALPVPSAVVGFSQPLSPALGEAPCIRDAALQGQWPPELTSLAKSPITLGPKWHPS